jgi:hypothetical protein
MKRFLPLALAAVALSLAGRASAEPGRAAALKGLIEALPAVNPNDDPSYWDVGEYSVEEQLVTCHYEADAMNSMDQLLGLIDKYMAPGGAGKAKLIALLKQMPDFQGEEGKKNLSGLSMGLSLAPDVVRSTIIAKNCRAMLKFQFTSGASRAQLLKALEQEKARLESAPAPKD